MKVLSKIEDMRDYSREVRRAGGRVGFVPTMGCLHEGHLRLVDEARRHCTSVVVSIYVNPTQFGHGEDLGNYPRDFEGDCAKCEGRGVDVVFSPETGELYPADASTWVVEEELSLGLCGSSRPGHFRGVATVVAKLFNCVLPDVAVFGLKDYQQAAVIRRMARDLNFPVKIVTCETVREADGLAMSSRNRYLSPDDRTRALSIMKSLREAKELLERGKGDIPAAMELVKLQISQAGGRLDYVDVVDAETLEPQDNLPKKAVIAVAASFGGARLIDNIAVIPGCAVKQYTN